VLLLVAVLPCNGLVNLPLGRRASPLSLKSEQQQGQNTDDVFNTNTRLVLSGLALSGAAETGYLTYAKLTSSPLDSLLCAGGGAIAAASSSAASSSSSSCSDVLTGPFSVIPFINVPLTAVALLGYAAVACLSLLPILKAESSTAVGANQQQQQQQQQEQETIEGLDSLASNRSSILFITTAMATFSSYLMLLLTYVLQASCNYCYLSAALSLSMAFVAWTNKVVPNATRAFVVTASSASVTVMSSIFLFYATSVLTLTTPAAEASTAPAYQAMMMQAKAKEQTKPAAAAAAKEEEDEATTKIKAPPRVSKPSSAKALEVANRLQRLDAKMYGAYWCSHCYNQKQNLGSEAVHLFEYIECDKEGVDSQYPLCKAKKVPGYPTWELQGKLYPGEKTVDELGALLDSISASAK